MRAATSPEEIKLDLDALRGVAERARSVISTADHDTLTKALEQISALNRLVRERGTTLARLRRLFHLSGSERTEEVLGRSDESAATAATVAATVAAAPTSDAPSSPAISSSGSEAGSTDAGKKKGKNKGRTPSSAYRNATHVDVPHPDLRAGAVCPGCECAKLNKMKEPARTVRLDGTPPIAATCWDRERLRCSACGEIYTAPEPPEAQGPKYTERAAALIGLMHYGVGMPFHRQERLQKNLETPLPSSTQWDIMRDRAKALAPVYAEMLRQAAGGTLLHADDTFARILELMGKRRARQVGRGALETPERTGIFTSGVLATTTDKKQIALFLTGRKHAGENLARILALRASELGSPVLMSDALTRNVPVGHIVIEANCLAHGRRNVVDEISNFPTECRKILEDLAQVFKHDEETRREKMTDADRLRFHQLRSGAILGRLRKWMREQLRDKLIEENSGLGSAIRYLLKHWMKLTLFLRRPGVPLTNNIIERALKMAIRHRRNSYFFRSENGAQVGDIYMSLIHTAELHGANAFDYLTELQRHAEEVAARPGDWMPWNYRATLAGTTPATEPRAVAA